MIVIAEGLAEIPARQVPAKASPATSTATSPSPQLNLADIFADLIAKEYTRQTGKKRKITGAAARLRSPAAPSRTPST